MDYFSWWRVCSVRTLRTALPEGARSAKQLRKSCANCRAKYEKKAKYRTISGERPWKAETPKSADHKQITEKESADRLSILNEYHNQGFPIMYCDVIPVPIRRLPNMLFKCGTFCSYGTLWNTPCWWISEPRLHLLMNLEGLVYWRHFKTSIKMSSENSLTTVYISVISYPKLRINAKNIIYYFVYSVRNHAVLQWIVPSYFA